MLLGQFGDWGAYKANPGGKDVCFALAKPTAAVTAAGRPQPRSVLRFHLDAAVREGEERGLGDRRLSAEGRHRRHRHHRGSTKYAMYTQDDGAWVKNAAEEAQMVTAMRKGGELVVTSESGRGTKTTDTYSLKGSARRSTRWRRSASRRLVVPAKAGTHTPCPLDNPGVMGPGSRCRSAGTTNLSVVIPICATSDRE